MALEKSFTTKKGNTANYWIITNYPSDRLAASGNITLLGYKSENLRQVDEPRETYCARKTVYIDQESWEQIYTDHVENGANIYKRLYEYVKNNPTTEQASDETPFFASAADHFDDTA